MPTVERTFVVRAPLAKVWDYLSDFVRLGSALPGCERVEILSARETDWFMDRKVGLIRKRFVVRTETTEFDAPRHAAWIGESKELSISGSVKLQGVDASRTSVTYAGAVRAKGPARQILNRYFKSRLESEIDEFVRNVRAKLELEPDASTDPGAENGSVP